MGTKQQRVRPGWRSTVFAVMTLLLVGLGPLNNAAGAQTQTAANAVTTFNVHSSAGVQAEPAITVILRDGNGPEYEIHACRTADPDGARGQRGTFVPCPRWAM